MTVKVELSWSGEVSLLIAVDILTVVEHTDAATRALGATI